MDKIYNLIIPIGCFCGVIMQLDRLKLRHQAYPFDWNITTLAVVTHFIGNDFEDFFNLKGVSHPGAKDNIMYKWIKYPNTWAGIVHYDMTQDSVKETFKRRIARWKETLNNEKQLPMLFLHETFNLDINSIELFIDTINKQYPLLDFHIVIILDKYDSNIIDFENEYAEKSQESRLYSIYTIHQKELRQAITTGL